MTASRATPASRFPVSDRRAERTYMPVIKVDNQQYSLRPGPNRLGAGADADVRVEGDAALGVQAIVDLGANAQAVIRRAGQATSVRVNGIALVDPTPLMHGDKVEIAGKELLYAEDAKAGNTSFVSARTSRRSRKSAPVRRARPARPGGASCRWSTERSIPFRRAASRSGETRAPVWSSRRTKSRESTPKSLPSRLAMRFATSARTACS